MNRNDLLKKLHQRCNGYIELRALLGKEIPKIEFIPLNTDWGTIRTRVDKFCEEHKERNIYFGVATRDGKGGTKKNVASISCVWAEIDNKHFPEAPEARVQEVIEKFPFKPTIIVNSGGGLHLYWLFEKPVDLKRSEDVLRMNGWIYSELCKLCECKLDNIGEIARILRLPGTVNHKYEHKPLCKVVEINDNTYRLDDFIKMVPETVTKPTRNNKTSKGEELLNSRCNTELMKQVENVVKQAVEKNIILGDDSYDDWFRIGCALADGLGEEGRIYFHSVSAISSKYNKDDCDRQYGACLNGSKPDDKIAIATFFYYAKEAGVSKITVGTEGTVSDKEIIPECQFPFEIFPKRLRNLIDSFGTALHVSPELVASSFLPIMSGAIGNAVKISPKSKWEEPPFIWLNIIGVTGYGKTPVINTMMGSINNMQGEAHKKYQEEYKEYKQKLEDYKEFKKKEKNDGH